MAEAPAHGVVDIRNRVFGYKNMYICDGSVIAANLGVTSNGVSIALAGVVAATALYAAWRAPLWRWFAAGIAGSLLMVPHVYGYDAAVLLLPVLLAIFKASGRGARYSAMAIALPCVFWLPAAGSPWAMGPALAISAFLIFVARERESDAFEPAAKAASGMVRVPA